MSWLFSATACLILAVSIGKANTNLQAHFVYRLR
jgi:hypothetical protein